MSKDQEMLKTKVITPEVICSFPYLFEISDYTQKYGLSIPIPESDKAAIKQIKTAIGNAAENKWGAKARAQIGKKIESPLRTGNKEKEDDAIYKDTLFFSANSTTKPGVINIDNRQITAEDDAIYPGCILRASVVFYAYDFTGKKGVACGLQNVMKVKDGDQIGGKPTAEDDFSDFSSDEFKEDLVQDGDDSSEDDVF